MILSGKTIQSVADELIYPFLNNLLYSEDEIEVREALNHIDSLVDLGVDRKNFPGIHKILYHKNPGLAHHSFEILRKPSSDMMNMELKDDVWKAMYPFFCELTLSSPGIAADSLKILDILVDYHIVGDHKILQKALLHKSDKVSHFTLDVLRKIKGIKVDTLPIKEVPENKPKSTEETGDIENKILNVLKKNPKYIEGLKEIKNKYKIE